METLIRKFAYATTVITHGYRIFSAGIYTSSRRNGGEGLMDKPPLKDIPYPKETRIEEYVTVVTYYENTAITLKEYLLALRRKAKAAQITTA
jgi:hypothetical protein